jgi:hypothetical protein
MHLLNPWTGTCQDRARSQRILFPDDRALEHFNLGVGETTISLYASKMDATDSNLKIMEGT